RDRRIDIAPLVLHSPHISNPAARIRLSGGSCLHCVLVRYCACSVLLQQLRRTPILVHGTLLVPRHRGTLLSAMAADSRMGGAQTGHLGRSIVDRADGCLSSNSRSSASSGRRSSRLHPSTVRCVHVSMSVGNSVA